MRISTLSEGKIQIVELQINNLPIFQIAISKLESIIDKIWFLEDKKVALQSKDKP